jgi:hypothetical protein
MNDDTATQEPTTPNELEDLKARADTLGVAYHPSIGVSKLREKVAAGTAPDIELNKAETEPKVETKNAFRLRKKREASELVRIQITCMNPNKREYDGEIFMAGNSVVGTYRNFVPFDTVWHVPRVVFNMIKQRRCQVTTTRKGPKNRPIKEGKLIREYSVVELDPLTPEELQELAQRQAMAKGTAATD